ncbi:cyclic nucleotide-binding/CBS domain-containing protein [Rhodoferax sp.]|uniref:CBS domain-containing protein n=1 Tax=Rhodoferax sp. TaxID=50421 RepID=UPI002749CA8D|nr:CBS domain-containing protein [Rhodoferax sp.]
MPERTVFQSVAHRHVVSVPPHASVLEAACIMTTHHCSSVLIIDSSGVMLGILTEHDLLTRVLAKGLSPQTTHVSEVMTRDPHCVGPDLKVADAILIMIERGFANLPIVSASKILGVFSVRDAMPRELGNAVSLAEFHDQVNDALG